MRSAYFSSLIVAAALSLFTAQQACAQNGAIHGISLSGLSQGGCLNLTGFTPPRYPGVPGRIPCEEFLQGTIATQGQRTNALSLPGELTANLPTTTYVDAFSNQFSQESANYRVIYGLGDDNYSEFVQDNALRTRSYYFSSSGLVNALNANPALLRALAHQQVVDGSSIGFQIEGGNFYLEVLKDAQRSIEITPIDPDNFNSLSDSTKNPYAIAWVTPSPGWTPHASIPAGIAFRSIYDQTLQRWRYFLDVDGSVVQTIGKYIVYFTLSETTGRLVQYQSQVEGLISRQIGRSLSATITIGYGIDQCVVESAIDVPTLEPLLGVYQAALNQVAKDMKKVNRLIRSEEGGSKARRLYTRQSRRIALAKEALALARALDMSARTIGIARLDQGAQTKLLIDLTMTARSVIAPGRNGSPWSVRRLLKAMKQLLLPRAPQSLSASKKKSANKTAKAFEGIIKAGDRELGSYLTSLSKLSDKIEQLRENTAQCGAVPL
jgi:hypothetical protein